MELTTTQARGQLGTYFGADAIEAMMDTAQQLGEVSLCSVSGHKVTLTADDDAQCWYVTAVARA